MDNKYVILIIVLVIILIIAFIIYCQVSQQTPHYIFSKKYYNDIYIENIPDLSKISNEKIIFMIPVFNSDIVKLKNRISYLVNGFKDYKICIYGLDSTNDTTISELLKYKQEDPMHIYLVSNIEIKDKMKIKRTSRLGIIREEILKYVNNLNLDNTWKVMIYDSDHVGPMSKIGMIDSIERLNFNQELYAICASGTLCFFEPLDFMYDPIAYVGSSNNSDNFKLSLKLYHFRDEYTKIVSGFSGACLYRLSDLKDLSYTSNTGLCEHVVLNTLLKNKYDKKYKKECFMEMSKKWHIYIGLQPSNVFGKTK